MNHVRVVASVANGYASGSNYSLVITTGTVNGISAVGYCVGSFSIEARSALRPTTATRTLDVAATGEAGLDFDNVKQATGATTLTNIRVPNVTLTDTVTAVTGLTASNLDATVSSRTKPADTQARVTLTDTVTTVTNAVAVTSNIKKNQALSAFSFPMFDTTDHVTPLPGLTVTAQRSIDGAAFGACTNSPTAISGGYYTISLSAADLNGNSINLKFSATGADTTDVTLITVP